MFPFCGSRGPKAPINPISDEKFKKMTDNYDRVMERTWYCIGSTQGQLEMFWEINTWNSAGPEHPLGKDCFSNHTCTKKPGKRMDDFGVWPGNAYGDKMGLKVMLPLPCGQLPAFEMSWIMLSFPANDSFKGFWTYAIDMTGDVCIFALTPHVSDALYQAELTRLKTEHGYTDKQLAKMSKVAWPDGYKPGDSGEESTNIEGKGATLAAEYAARYKYTRETIYGDVVVPVDLEPSERSVYGKPLSGDPLA